MHDDVVDLTGRRRLWWAIALVVIAAASIAAAAIILHRAAAPERPARAAAPPLSGAFATGGPLPAVPAEVARVFKQALPDYLIALDTYAQARRIGNGARVERAAEAVERARAEVLRPEGLAAVGAGAARELEAVVVRARQVADAEGSAVAGASDGFLEAVTALDDQLAAGGQAVFLDADVLEDGRGRRTIIAYAFLITEVNVYHHDRDAVRALRLRRLDDLNYEHALLGFTRPNLREALVLLDQLDETLANQVLPVLAPGTPFRLVESADGGDFAGREEVERRTGEAVRAEVLALAQVGAEPAARVGGVLRRRAELFAGWRKRLSPKGIVLSEPAGLRVTPGYFDELAALGSDGVPKAELEELRRLDQALLGEEVAAVAARVSASLTASVERHEVQHRLDGLAGGRRLPAALAAYVGEGGERARDELSAYLAELARGPAGTTRLELALLAHFLFDREVWGGAECWAAVTVFEGLGPAEGRLVGGGEIDRARAARILLSLLARPQVEVQAAAATLWERLFGAPLPRLDG